jgi:uncharacterized protein (TIGR02001 family)
VAPQAGLAVVLLGLAGSAFGQAVVSLTVESDFIFRGVSLSDGKPDASLSVDYDGASGWYAGGTVTAAEFDYGTRQAALLAYVGFARRTASGLAWEVGATGAHFAADSRYDYGEAFAGLIAQSWNARVYLSPSYFGSGVRTLYAELNGAAPLAGSWRLFAHVGALAPMSGGEPSDSQRVRLDARLGVSTTIGPAELRLAWVGATRRGFYPTSYADPRSALVLSAACFF